MVDHGLDVLAFRSAQIASFLDPRASNEFVPSMAQRTPTVGLGLGACLPIAAQLGSLVPSFMDVVASINADFDLFLQRVAEWVEVFQSWA
ncbi:hypothetical protein AFL94_09390 [Arthrobacter sp. LS16]|nr:hypothetical protein AFL94_09390 [Arthrobacter sp. LS16]